MVSARRHHVTEKVVSDALEFVQAGAAEMDQPSQALFRGEKDHRGQVHLPYWSMAATGGMQCKEANAVRLKENTRTYLMNCDAGWLARIAYCRSHFRSFVGLIWLIAGVGTPPRQPPSSFGPQPLPTEP